MAVLEVTLVLKVSNTIYYLSYMKIIETSATIKVLQFYGSHAPLSQF